MYLSEGRFRKPAEIYTGQSFANHVGRNGPFRARDRWQAIGRAVVWVAGTYYYRLFGSASANILLCATRRVSPAAGWLAGCLAVWPVGNISSLVRSESIIWRTGQLQGCFFHAGSRYRSALSPHAIKLQKKNKYYKHTASVFRSNKINLNFSSMDSSINPSFL